MRLLNARHFASAARGVGDLIFSKPTLAVEHEWELLAWEPNCVDLYRVGRKTAAVRLANGARGKDATNPPTLRQPGQRRLLCTDPPVLYSSALYFHRCPIAFEPLRRRHRTLRKLSATQYRPRHRFVAADTADLLIFRRHNRREIRRRGRSVRSH